MRKILYTILFLFLFTDLSARHIKGGFFTYKYLGPGITNSSYLRYKITLTVYMECNPNVGQVNQQINFTIFDTRSYIQLANPSVSITRRYDLLKMSDEPCISGEQSGCYYTVVEYELNNYELPASTYGYTISYQRCCRIESMDNIVNSGNVGNTYTIEIPGTNSPIANANRNNSPDFFVNDTIVVCANNFFAYPFKATDLDGDSLTYSLCDAYVGGAPPPGDAEPNPAFSPPYSTVPYQSPYDADNPMGAKISIDPATGLISGFAPPIRRSGEYVVTVCVSEYRNGIRFAGARKELHIRVRDCDPIKAFLNPIPVTCDGFTVGFNNATPTPSGTDFSWDFGDKTSGAANTSTSPSPSHTYTDTGVYIVKLKVSLGGFCADSTTTKVKVYPGFFPGFITTSALCKGQPVQFEDTTKTKYGTVTGWRWNFGDQAITGDTSHLQNPMYTYNKAGIYKNVQFIVANTFGCIDTVYKDITIADNPLLSVFPKDTTYCGLDNLRLTATGSGNFSWLPNTAITNSNTATPTVSPTTSTKYFVTLNNAGCISNDSVRVTPVNDLTASISTPSDNICEDDIITLTGSSNHSPISWQWSPTTNVQSPNNQITTASPASTTLYKLTAQWGTNCVATTTKNITVKPLAIPNAGPDAYICAGQTSTQLSASGGDNYTWTPISGLDNSGVANPLATPTTTTKYVVSVGVNGCTKRRTDTVEVLVRTSPLLQLTNDTLICSIDTLKLTATGNGNIVWSPNYMINNLNTNAPMVSPDIPAKYYATLTDIYGCKNNDSVFVDVRTFISVNAGKDTTICRGDEITLHPISEALQYSWTPIGTLNNATLKNPIANPTQTTTYKVTANLGKCQDKDEVNIIVVPYPTAQKAKDTSICFGTVGKIYASGGSIYSWSPGTFLSDSSTASPSLLSPTASIQYIATVRDLLGCPKPVYDTFTVNVIQKVIADAGPRDTAIVIGEPLFLHATGAEIYSWLPKESLDNPSIADPIATPGNDIEYVLYAKTKDGCNDTDTIKVKVYKIDPDLYVPTAFSPNSDGINDIFKPILLGVKQLKYFNIFNRWGQLVFSSTTKNIGWDGTFGGKAQDPGTYVWQTEGVSYQGKKLTKKGYVVLIR